MSENALIKVLVLGDQKIQKMIRKMCNNSNNNPVSTIGIDFVVINMNDYKLQVKDTPSGFRFRDNLKKDLVSHSIIIVCANNQENLKMDLDALNALTKDNSPSLNEKILFIAAPEKNSLTNHSLPVITVNQEGCFHTQFFDALRAEAERLKTINRANRKAAIENPFKEKIEEKIETRQTCSMM